VVVLPVLAEFVIVKAATGTLVAQAASVLPAAQLLPAAVEVSWVVRTLSPLSGLFTATEYVSVTLPPTARLPLQVRTGLE
jgi:hypothetical protein